MPVLINSENQLAEDLPQEQADLALNSGTHQLPFNDPQGNPVVAPLGKASQLLSQGYTQPHPEQLGSLLKYAKYSEPSEQIKTGLEGAASAATFGLSTGAERALGVHPEDINARAEVNPNAKMAGEAAGLLGSALIGTGEGALLGKVGAAITGRLAAESALAKVGSAAARNAVETAMVASGNEVSKMFASDPEQSAQTALVNIGLNGLLGAGIGGAFGTASPLWKAASETKVGQFLNTIKNKADGLGKETLPSPEIQNALDHVGIDIPHEMKAALSENPEARGMFQALQESTTRAGKESQASFQLFRERANQAALKSLGKSEADLDALASLSENDVGSKIQDSLKNEIKQKIDPLTEKFEKVKAQFSNTDLQTAEVSELGNQIAQLAEDQGYGILKGTSQGGLINKVLDSLPNLKTLEDLRKLQSQVGEQTQNPEMWGLGKGLKNIFRNAEETIVESKLAEKSPELLGEHQAARAGYRDAMDTLDDLNDRLHVGKYAGPGSFLTKLSEMNPEDILRRLTTKNDANLLGILQEKFPAAAQGIKESFLNQALKQAEKKASPGEAINMKSLFNVMDKWSPEIKEFALPPGATKQIDAIRSILDQLPTKMNNSGTAKTLDALWSHVPGGVGSMVSLMTGHNPVLGYVMGQLGKYVGREVPDAIKLATLKFLGSDLPVNSAGFRAMAELVSHSMEGQKMIENGVKSVFKSGAQVLPQKLNVSEKDRNKLKKKIDELETKPESLLDTGGDTHYYLPDHAGSFGATAARAFEYLKSLKPDTSPEGILDPKRSPNPVEEQKYNRALDIAEQPLVALKHIHQGTLLPEDVVALKTMYPALYTSLSQKLMDQVITLKEKKEMIPYSKKMALSLFMMQPMDSTLTPEGIQNAQMVTQAPIPQQQMPGQPKMRQHHTMTALNKLPGMYQTPGQARQQDKLTS